MYTEAIADCDVALRLPNPAEDTIYYNRGMARIHKHEWTEAIVDLIVAMVKGANLVGGFTYDRYGSTEVLEKIIEAPLPESISNLLTGNLNAKIEGRFLIIRMLAEDRDVDIEALLLESIRNLLTDRDEDIEALSPAEDRDVNIEALLLESIRNLLTNYDVDIEAPLPAESIRNLLTNYDVDVEASLLESIRNLLTDRDED